MIHQPRTYAKDALGNEYTQLPVCSQCGKTTHKSPGEALGCVAKLIGPRK